MGMSDLAPRSYSSTQPPNSHLWYEWPAACGEIERLGLTDRRAFELGCGNGAVANSLSQIGFTVAGVDPSESGVALANREFKHLRIELGSTNDDLASRFGTFPLVISLEVMAHCYSLWRFTKVCYDLLDPGGFLIISAAYHGYLKNLALSVKNSWDFHHSSLGDGHTIKFLSERTMRELLDRSGFDVLRFVRVGRVPMLAKAMIVTAVKRAC
jgi:2-polyprenyl-3-methyl-5-hydroxy-6-metoxy-1,4-benzoquinol methylase